MMDKENHDLNLDRDFVADLGVPFICPKCNELFGSQEYLNQHSDVCHSLKHSFTSETDSDAYQPQDFPRCRQPENLLYSSSVLSSPASNSNFDSNCVPTPRLCEQESHASYSALPLSADTHVLSPNGFQLPTLQAEVEFSPVSVQRNDVLLSSTTENAHSFSQSCIQLATQVPESKPVHITGNRCSPASQPTSCPGCQNIYINEWFLEQHLRQCVAFISINRSSHENRGCAEQLNINGPIACPWCKLLYINQRFLNQHLLTCSVAPQNHHPIDVPAPGIHQSFDTQSSQDSHQQPYQSNRDSNQHFSASKTCGQSEQCTSPDEPFLQITVHPGSVEKVDATTSPFTCPQCGKKFAQKGSLQAHIRSHNGEKPFKCEKCGQGFVIKSNLIKHYNTHTQEKPHVCTTCGDSFSLKTGLTRHLRTHTGEKPFECAKCGQRFSSTGNLKKHSIIHSSGKSFSCKICGRRFQCDEALQAHVAIHTGEKNHQCPMCDSAFLHRGGLDAHFRTHTGEKPFACGMCDVTFARKGGLKAHMRTHTGEKPYKCTVCWQAFSHKSNLNAHTRTHTGEKPFGCNLCDQKFAHKSNLRKHVNSHVDTAIVSSPAGSSSDSSCAIIDMPVTSSAPVISAVTKMTSVMVSPFSDDNDSNFFDILDMLEYPSTQALLQA